MDEFLNQIVTFGSGALTTATTLGLLKGPVQTFQDWWYINHGYNSSEKAAILKAKTEINVEKLKNEALKEMSKIKPENIKEPEMIILGPTLEASKYYINHEELRSMFAKLLASSMDKSKENITHSAYVEIIKQMTPVDAQNLNIISMFYNSYIPVANIKLLLGNNNFNTIHRYLFVANKEILDQNIQSPSINNLHRLGLINISFDEFISEDRAYDEFINLPQYENAQKIIENNNTRYQELQNMIKDESDYQKIEELNRFAKNMFLMSGPELQKGFINLTPFGQNFCSTCF